MNFRKRIARAAFLAVALFVTQATVPAEAAPAEAAAVECRAWYVGEMPGADWGVWYVECDDGSASWWW